MHAYGTRDVERLIGVSVAAVRSLIRAGYLKPRKGDRGQLQFSFQDLIILRTARTLSAARLSARRINRCLRELRRALPASLPLSGLSIAAVGDRVAVREGRRRWDTESGQYLLALDVAIEAGELRVIARETRAGVGEARAVPGDRSGAAAHTPEHLAEASGTRGQAQAEAATGEIPAASHYERAYELEEIDVAAAIAAYERCLASHAGHAEARVNCGRLLHLAGRLEEAERLYRQGDVADATLLFNLGVLLEDAGREAEAIDTYRQALALEAGLADAHFNLARLYERAGKNRESFRHLLAYKRASERG
jgi:tetratricopeptide (TPR) repeat protein